MRLVLDTNAIISGLLWHGAPSQLIDFAISNQVVLFTSVPMLTELQRVLLREKFVKQLESHGLTADELFDGYAALAIVLSPTSIEPAVIRDPDDDHVLACALAAGADLIVSGDADLLTLMQYANIPIVTPLEALARIQQTLPS